MLSTISSSLFAGLFMIGFLVVVHEAGHFVFAKLFGVGVPVFSVGMGPRLFGVVWRGTDYRVSALPVGGYVQMSGADPFGEEDQGAWVDPDEDFMRKPVWQRLVVMAAGPGVNLVLPFVLFTLLLMGGRPEVDSRLGAVHPESQAAVAGLAPGDRIAAVDGQPVEVWHDVLALLEGRLAASSSGDLELAVERDGAQRTVVLPGSAVAGNATGGPDLALLGMEPFVYPALVGPESANSPAGRAGLRRGDLIVSVDGVAVEDWHALAAALTPAAQRVVAYKRMVDDQVVDAEVTLTFDAAYAVPNLLYSNPWGLVPAMLLIEQVVDASPASRAGLQSGDRLVAVDGVRVATFGQFMDLVSRSVEDGVVRPLELEVARDGVLMASKITPEVKVVAGDPSHRPIIGVSALYREPYAAAYASKYYSLFEALPRAWDLTVEVVWQTVQILRNIFSMESDWRENVGGPIAIFWVAGVVAEQGFFRYAETIGVISISLGLINLLPVPVLDGGQILFYLIEGVRGRPLSLEFRERVQMLGVLALVVIMLVVVFNDISRISTYTGGPG
jgi:regulator of sigma E protease